MIPAINQLLEAIRHASSKKPAVAADVRKKLGLHIDDFASIYQSALEARLIYDARITRGGVEQLVCWPTGVILPPGRQGIVITPSRHTAGFSERRDVPSHVHKQPGQQRSPTSKVIASLITNERLTVDQLCERTGLTRSQISNGITRMRGRVSATRTGKTSQLSYQLNQPGANP